MVLGSSHKGWCWNCCAGAATVADGAAAVAAHAAVAAPAAAGAAVESRGAAAVEAPADASAGNHNRMMTEVTHRTSSTKTPLHLVGNACVKMFTAH